MKIPQRPEEFTKLLAEITGSSTEPNQFATIFQSGLGPAQEGTYRHWDTLRHLKPPTGLNHEEWWLGIKLARLFIRHIIPLRGTNGEVMHYTTPDILYKMCSEIDRNATGSIYANEPVFTTSDREFYVFKSLTDEAISSSQLEGASTTREVAREMIRTGRQPRDKSERMIFNNYVAMGFIRQIKDLPLTPSIIFSIHRFLTEGTLDNPEAAGRLRRADEDVVVFDESTGETLHVPPPAAELEQRLTAICAFANDLDSKDYIHPVVRAIILHFWLAYDHPFVDGNGRTARAIFYWSMARQNYWLFEFIAISSIIREGPARYAKAFLYVETDDFDLTYFILNQLKVILRAMEHLHQYLRRKETEILEVHELLIRTNSASAIFNHRQMAVLNHALKNPYAIYTTQSHRRSHSISLQTARNDLSTLASHGLLIQQKRGHGFAFIAPPDLRARIKALKIQSGDEQE